MADKNLMYRKTILKSIYRSSKVFDDVMDYEKYKNRRRESQKFWKDVEKANKKSISNYKKKETARKRKRKELDRKLNAKNNNIFLITARWDKEDCIILKKTVEWLKKYGINYSKLYLGYKDKSVVVKDNNIEIFIDDNYKTCKKISEMNVRTLIMNSRMNKDIEDNDLERVFSWKEIEDKIK